MTERWPSGDGRQCESPERRMEKEIGGRRRRRWRDGWRDGGTEGRRDGWRICFHNIAVVADKTPHWALILNSAAHTGGDAGT